MEPRSYDYHRLRTWDDRLRMPQFKFARIRPHPGEAKEAFRARQEKEEAEAREAVMTFVLGLVADPVSLKYVHAPAPDRLAEVKGRQVLEKYNCAGCHQVRPGVYEFKPTDKTREFLEANYKTASGSFATDHVFTGHNAWTGGPQPSDRLVAFGVPRAEEDSDDPDRLIVRLADALRFTGKDGVVRDLPAGSFARLSVRELIARADPYGGTFTELMVPYLGKKDPARFQGKPDDARSALPPPLYREGERVQTKWLHGFLLNPPPVRPAKHMVLRMPKFNMSEEEASQLVNYFAAVSKVTNPGAGVTYPYLTIAQQGDDQYWRQRNEAYNRTLEGRIKEVQGRLDAVRKEEKEAKDDATRKQKKQEADGLEGELKRRKEQAAKKDENHYARDAYRLVTNKELCLKCHSVGGTEVEGATGPNLALSSQRLRPEWTLEWVANPARLFTYSPVMPQNFANGSLQYQDYFVGPPLQQARAVRDVLMDMPRLADLPGNKAAPAAAGGGK
jgi:mono/diheme cytochrome c family protein